MKKKILFIFLLLFIAFMPRIVFATSTDDKIHFIKNSNSASEAIVIESNGHFGLVDTMSPGPSSPLASSYSNLVNNVDNGTKVYNYLKALGSNHLDFIIITHNDYEHSGGISELLELVDNDTIVFYKEDVAPNDEIEPYNHIVYTQQMSYLNSKNAIVCNVLTCNPSSISNDYISGITKNDNTAIEYATNLKKKINFDFGDFGFNLYNLYTLSNYNENLNSIVALITHKTNNKKVLLLGDLESGYSDYDYAYAQNVANKISNPTQTEEEYEAIGIDGQLALIINGVDVVKAADHASANANSTYAFRRYEADYYIIADTYSEDANGISIPSSAVAQITNFNDSSGTISYYTKQADGAIVLDFNNSDYTVKNYTTSGVDSGNGLSPIRGLLSSQSTTGWFEINGLSIKNKITYYMYNGVKTLGWKKIDNVWYYFYTQGEMVIGYHKIGDDYYYFMEDELADSTHTTGSLVTGLFKVANGDIFYFNEEVGDDGRPKGEALGGFKTIDSGLYYFRTDDDQISPGRIYSAVKGIAVINDETYYFRTATDDVSTGAEGTAVKNECVIVGNKRYCFDNNYHAYSVTTFATIPTNAMCNDLTYTGEEQTLTKKALAGYSWSSNTGTNAGSYQVVATLNEGYQWSDDTTEPIVITCSIHRIKVSVPTLEYDTYHYVGTPIALRVNAYDTAYIELTGTFNATEIGNYSVTASLNNTEILEWEDGTDTSVIINWRIVKGLISDPHIYSASEVYDGLPHTVRLDPIPEGTLYYKTDDTDWSVEKPTRTDVGITTIYAKIVGNGHYNDSNIVNGYIEVTRAAAPAPIVTNYGGKCDGEPHSITVEPVTTGTIYYKTDDTDWSTTNPFRIDIGETTVYVKVVGTGNYSDSSIVEGKIRLIGEKSYLINNYEYNDTAHYIYGIPAGTTLSELSESIVLGYGYTVSIDTITVGGKKLIYTGGKTKIKDGSLVVAEYSNVVLGDANGDGTVGILDYIKIRKDIMDIEKLDFIHILAADMNRNDSIDIFDYIRVRKIIMEEE